jgi:hypothetical protein
MVWRVCELGLIWVSGNVALMTLRSQGSAMIITTKSGTGGDLEPFLFNRHAGYPISILISSL